MSGGEPVLRIEGLYKSYRRRPVLQGVSLTVSPSDAVAVIGPNGAGKSTFLGCLSGERLPDSGSIRICGFDPFADSASVAECMGFVPEQPFLYGELTVLEILRFIAEVRHLDRDHSAAEAARLLELFGLLGAEGTLCRELSQGMNRKVAIIAALLHRPRLLVLDEVFNGLDNPSSEALLSELESRREEGSAVLLSSHDLALLADHCNRGLLLAPDGSLDLVGDHWRRWRESPGLASR
jgi:ABC-2 type transport system ATP-binding protein